LGWRLCEAANEPRIGSRLPAGHAGHKITETDDSSSTVQLAAKAHGSDPAQIEKRSVSESTIRCC